MVLSRNEAGETRKTVGRFPVVYREIRGSCRFPRYPSARENLLEKRKFQVEGMSSVTGIMYVTRE
jgi:hypothetical protein